MTSRGLARKDFEGVSPKADLIFMVPEYINPRPIASEAPTKEKTGRTMWFDRPSP